MVKNHIAKLIHAITKRRESSSEIRNVPVDDAREDEPNPNQPSIQDLRNNIDDTKKQLNENMAKITERSESLDNVRKRSDTVVSISSELFDTIDNVKRNEERSSKRWSLCNWNRNRLFIAIAVLIAIGVITFFTIVST
ncbi:hypothetical protein TrispH2_005813 [Trichoplax sp. H2]|nr:hypothetical protein TrispH2_005813 [Trichoplax sp. H2]|eukprot:RDD41931.1 hypothetical protein TrispH2_005813 [Trichoplax sp. H2]